jgi:hypothetical protein
MSCIRRFLPFLVLGILISLALAETTERRDPSEVRLGSLSYSDGDLFIGFRATDGTLDYLVNIFQPNHFADISRRLTFQVNTGNMLTDLVSVFGPDWYTRIDPGTGTNAVLWAVVGGRQVAGGGDVANALYSSNPSSTPWPRHSDTVQGVVASLIAQMAFTFVNGLPTTNNPNGTIQNASDPGSYASSQPFKIWTPTNEGAPNANLYFDRITPGAGSSTSLGHFSLSSSGQLIFHAAQGQQPQSR